MFMIFKKVFLLENFYCAEKGAEGRMKEGKLPISLEKCLSVTHLIVCVETPTVGVWCSKGRTTCSTCFQWGSGFFATSTFPWPGSSSCSRISFPSSSTAMGSHSPTLCSSTCSSPLKSSNASFESLKVQDLVTLLDFTLTLEHTTGEEMWLPLEPLILTLSPHQVFMLKVTITQYWCPLSKYWIQSKQLRRYSERFQ